MNEEFEMLRFMTDALNAETEKANELVKLVHKWIDLSDTLSTVSPAAAEAYLTCAEEVANIYRSK